ncbi:diguanylate cyclase domain-containing protein [Ideonella sp.]|uniref:diguanylate cyclase domain-containing protein n=1 Tax=Ideonella sp. TaxID=1929293 RepID=UPI002B47739D|nr:diguanylate cyclase [Ideonella sp.]HJV67503.1 diguanylate cyclase [Ideonella sp.]
MDRTRPIDPQTLTWLELGEAQRLLIDQFPRLVFGLDLAGHIQWMNRAGAETLGFEPGELRGQPLIGSLLRREEVEARAAMLGTELRTRVPADARVFSARLQRGLPDEHDWLLRSKGGEPRQTRLSLGTLRDAHGVVTGLIAVERAAETAIDAPIAMAHHDSLTGLPNRAVLQDRAEMAIQRAARAGTQIGVLLIEFDGFAALCEQHGPSFGDDLLRAAAGRLHFELRKTDTAVRLDDGQFAAMLVDLHHAGEAEMVARKIAAALAGPVNTGIEVLHPKCRVGVAVYPQHGDQLLRLLEAAETALAQARTEPGAIVRTADSAGSAAA